MAKGAKTIQCHQCKDNECLALYPQGIPEYCQAQRFLDLIEESKRQQYLQPDTEKFHSAAAKVPKRGGYDWSRVQQCIEFAKELGAKKVGLAVCVGPIREGREFARFLDRAGFQGYFNSLYGRWPESSRYGNTRRMGNSTWYKL